VCKNPEVSHNNVIIHINHQYVLINRGVNELTGEGQSGAVAEFWSRACVHTVINS